MHLPAAVAIAVPCILAASIALAAGYRAEISNCRASVEEWDKREAADGRKILETHGQIGALRELTVRWDSGTIQRVTVGPTVLADGASAICVLARSHVGESRILPSGYQTN